MEEYINIVYKYLAIIDKYPDRKRQIVRELIFVLTTNPIIEKEYINTKND